MWEAKATRKGPQIRNVNVEKGREKSTSLLAY
jgi:hypothetical protein